MIETKDSNNKLFSKLKCEIRGKKSPVFCFPTRGENFTKGRRKGERVRGKCWPRREERFRSDNRPLHASGLDFDRTGGQQR